MNRRRLLVPFLLAAGATLVYGCGRTESEKRPANSPGIGSKSSLTGAPPTGSYPDAPLSPGDETPAVEALGWLNGPCPDLGPKGPRVIVVDLWALWCPVCRDTAPGLVQVYNKFKDRDVAFVSLTNMPEVSVRQFVKQCTIPWPCGYGATNQTIARFGAYSSKRRVPGYEVSPTLYVVGPDRRILWNDRQARMFHKDPGPLMKELETQIEQALTHHADANGK
jgi:thiol-disulfide isomerase/thioredoxin